MAGGGDLEAARLRLGGAIGGVVAFDTLEELRVQAWLEQLLGRQQLGPAGQPVVVRRWSPAEGWAVTPGELATWVSPNRTTAQTKHPWTFLRDLCRLPAADQTHPRVICLAMGLIPLLPRHPGEGLQLEAVLPEDPTRLLRDVAQHFRDTGHVLVLPGAPMPDLPMWRPHVLQFRFPMLGHGAIGQVLDGVLDDWLQQQGGSALGQTSPRTWPPALRDELLRLARGLTQPQIEDALWAGLMESGLTDAGTGVRESLETMKRLAIRQIQGLELIESHRGPALGGAHALKAWVATRAPSFTPAAKRFGVEAPRGLLAVGVPGAGKGVAARHVARELRAPLLRLEWGALMGAQVGESERALRAALEVSELQAPCVLWIDEIDKALVTTSGGGDGASHVARGLLGTLLTWLQERQAPVVAYFTANRLEGLPPELLRKGRLDEVFFFDLPIAQERAEILELTLGARAAAAVVDPLWTALVRATEGFSGAECAAVIQQGLVTAYAAGRELQVSDCLLAASATVPLIRGQPELMHRIRSLVQDGRAVRATPTSAEHARFDDLLEQALLKPPSSGAPRTGRPSRFAPG